MTTQAIGQTPQEVELVAAFRAAAPESRDRKFWITLSLAMLIHLMVLIGIVRSPTRQMGNPNSPSDAVAVSFVTEAELRSAETGADGGPSAPPPGAQPTPQPPPPEPPPPEQQTQPQPETPPVPPEPKAEATPPQPAPAPKAEEVAKEEEKPVAPEPPPLAENTDAVAAVPKEKPEDKPPVEPKAKPQEKKVEVTKDLEKELPELLELPDPSRQARPAQPARKQQQQAMRAPDMTLPGQQKTMMQSFDGKSAGIERPAGITRSGANDDFARGVIRALRATMPQMNALGRTTVRIIINQNGNIESVEVLARSENTDLNRAIVFSTKQASFPFPPNGATILDRTFTITYIYH